VKRLDWVGHPASVNEHGMNEKVFALNLKEVGKWEGRNMCGNIEVMDSDLALTDRDMKLLSSDISLTLRYEAFGL
jgi:hypothetical protein